MTVLGIDASTYTGTVALIRDGEVAGVRTAAMRGVHEERLMPAVEALLAAAGLGVESLAAVACGAGPGSFTSLRIAASIAKGIARARGIRLIVAPSPLLIVAGAGLAPGRYVAVLDAMRGDLFGLEVQVGPGGLVAGVGDPWRAPRGEAEQLAAGLGARMVGPGEPEPQPPHARGFAELLGAGLAREVDAASWEPDYGRKAEAQVRWEAAHGRELGGR